jgi:hypothetical protein
MREKRKQTMYEDKDKVGVPMTKHRTKEQDNDGNIYKKQGKLF